MSTSIDSIDEIMTVMRQRWQRYLDIGEIDQFVEFSLTLTSLVEYFGRLRLSGLMRLCQGLENLALSKMGNIDAHPLAAQEIAMLARQIETLSAAVNTSRQPNAERRTEKPAIVEQNNEWARFRGVWIIRSPSKNTLAEGLQRQLEFFGFKIMLLDWESVEFPESIPLASIFIPAEEKSTAEQLLYIANIRSRCPTTQLVYLGAERTLRPIVELIRAGIDVTIPEEEGSYGVLNCILDLVQTTEPEKSKVLIVEDSRVAIEVIQRALTPHGIDTFAINDPEHLITVLDSYRPDLILMDMYMPNFNGIEATRVLRQLSAFRAVPVVYLSAESDIGMQVEALKLGGDQFLTKPFNPILLNAIVKTKIERFRETQRSTQIDGLTGLLNHTAVKSRLQALTLRAKEQDVISVAMLDIDHFKSVNDTYGHPVGDQVIRGLAWLLKGRLRATDLIGRYGGEEFLVVLPGANAEQTFKILDKIREDFSTLPHAHHDGTLHSSFSAGLATYPLLSSAALVTEAADGALLEAKRMGRNCVKLAQ